MWNVFCDVGYWVVLDWVCVVVVGEYCDIFFVVDFVY